MKLATGIIGFASLVYFVISIIQWFFLYPDTSQLLLGLGIAFGLFLISILYERLFYCKLKVESVEKRLDSIVYKREDK